MRFKVSKNYIEEISYFFLFTLIIYLAFLILDPKFSTFYAYDWFETVAYAKIDSSLYVKDRFIQDTKIWTPYATLINILVATKSKFWPIIYLLGWLTSFVFLFLSSIIFLNAITKSKNQRLKNLIVLTSFVLFFVTNNFFYNYGGIIPGSTDIIYPFFNTQMLASSISIFSLCLFFFSSTKQIHKLIIFCLLNFIILNLHIHIAIYNILFHFLFSNRERYLKVTKYTIISLILCAPLQINLFNFILIDLKAINLDHFLINYLGYFRQPHHLIPSKMNVFVWIYFLLFFIVFYYISLNKKNLNTFLITFNKKLIYLVIFVTFFGWFFVEIFTTNFFLKLQVYRIFIYFKFFGIIIIVNYLINIFFIGKKKNIEKKSLNFKKKIIYGLASLLFIILSMNKFYKQHIETLNNKNQLGTWISKYTNTDSLIHLVDYVPEIIIDSKRSIFWDRHRFPFSEKAGSDWINRFCQTTLDKCQYKKKTDYFNLYKNNMNKLKKFSISDWKMVFKNTGCDYIVSNISHKIPGKIIARDKNIVIRKCSLN